MRTTPNRWRERGPDMGSRHPRVTRRFVATVALACACGGTLAGCFFGEDLSNRVMGVRNNTNETLGVVVDDNVWPDAPPGRVRTVVLNDGPEGSCTEWRVAARTADGVEVAHLGPPVCDGDQLVVTQAELDQARLEAGKPAPTPTPTPDATPSPTG